MPGLRQTIWRGALVAVHCGRGDSASKLGSESCSCIFAGDCLLTPLFMEDFPRDICPTDSLSSVLQMPFKVLLLCCISWSVFYAVS